MYQVLSRDEKKTDELPSLKTHLALRATTRVSMHLRSNAVVCASEELGLVTVVICGTRLSLCER
jgi:hypothetical protein